MWNVTENGVDGHIRVARGQTVADRYPCMKRIGAPWKKKRTEIETERRWAASSIFDERLFAIPNKRIVDAIRRRNSYWLHFTSLASTDDGEIFDEEEETLLSTSNMLGGIKRAHLWSRMPWGIASELLVQCCWTWTAPKNLSVRWCRRMIYK